MGKIILMCFIGVSAGITVGSAIAAFVTLLQVVPRLTQITETRDYIKLYEYTFTFSVTLFSFIYFLSFNFKLSKYLCIPIGLNMGIFVGLFASALAEVLNVVPVFSKKFKVKHELKFIIGALICGKVIGSLFYWIKFIKH